MRHVEKYRTNRTGWLRAAVSGENDGIVSAASLVLGVAATGAALPLLIVVFSPLRLLVRFVPGNSILFLASLGTLAAHAGDAPVLLAAERVTFWAPWQWR